MKVSEAIRIGCLKSKFGRFGLSRIFCDEKYCCVLGAALDGADKLDEVYEQLALLDEEVRKQLSDDKKKNLPINRTSVYELIYRIFPGLKKSNERHGTILMECVYRNDHLMQSREEIATWLEELGL